MAVILFELVYFFPLKLMEKSGHLQKRIHLLYPLDIYLKMNCTLKVCICAQWLQNTPQTIKPEKQISRWLFFWWFEESKPVIWAPQNAPTAHCDFPLPLLPNSSKCNSEELKWYLCQVSFLACSVAEKERTPAGPVVGLHATSQRT